MRRRPSSTTRTDPLFPSTTLCGSAARRGAGGRPCPDAGRGRGARGDRRLDGGASGRVSARNEARSRWPIRILHLHSSFSLGGKEARAVRLMNLMGDRAHHTILSAVPGALGARAAIDPAITVDFPSDAPELHGKPSLARYRELARYFCDFDLVLSYNWGAMDGVMACRVHGSRWPGARSEEHTSELQSLMRSSYDVVRLKKKKL